MCECVGKGERTHTAQFIIEHLVEITLDTHDQASIVVAGNVDQTLRTLADVEQQGLDSILASEDPHGVKDRSLTNSIKPDQQALRAGTVNLFTRIPE